MCVSVHKFPSEAKQIKNKENIMTTVEKVMKEETQSCD